LNSLTSKPFNFICTFDKYQVFEFKQKLSFSTQALDKSSTMYDNIFFFIYSKWRTYRQRRFWALSSSFM